MLLAEEIYGGSHWFLETLCDFSLIFADVHMWGDFL